MSVHALHPSSETELPSWDAVWDVEQLAAYARVTTQTIYAAVARGDWDFARLPTGRAIRFAGSALAARFQIPGYQEGGESGNRGNKQNGPGVLGTPGPSTNHNY